MAKASQELTAEGRHESPVPTPNIAWLGDPGGVQAGGAKMVLMGQGCWAQIHVQRRTRLLRGPAQTETNPRERKAASGRGWERERPGLVVSSR